MTGTPEQVMEELAGAAMIAEPDDPDGIRDIVQGLKALVDGASAESNTVFVEPAKEALSLAASILEGRSEDQDSDLERIRQLIARVQDLMAGGEKESDALTSGELVLPDWVDPEVFQEFIGGYKGRVEELERQILEMESGTAGATAELRGSIHTLKGEAGVLGLEELERVCHRVEDSLERPIRNAGSIDMLLSVKDWISAALEAYAQSKLPDINADHLIDTLDKDDNESGPRQPGSTTDRVEAQEPIPTGGGNADLPVAHNDESSTIETAWDEDTMEVAGEFLQESEEGITTVDEVLLAAEDEGVSGEEVDSLFRVFHTIKGVSGFLELDEITKLAHTTETLLDRGRKGELEIIGGVLDLLFDSTEMMRKMLADLRTSMEAGVAFPNEQELPALLSRLQTAIQGGVGEEELPSVDPQERLGDILQRVSAVPASIIEQGLEAQKESGRRLGEELVASKAATPKQVSQAVRAQRRAGGSENKGAKIRETVKVDLERVDQLVEMIGELVIVESMVVNDPDIERIQSPKVRSHLGQLAKITHDLQGIGMRMRMVPVRGVFQKMARMVRDLSRKNGKSITAEMHGEGTEMDRSMVEQIADPLVHMIRNAVDHGIEPGEERVAAGKSRQGTVKLSAYHEGGSIVIEIKDDGRGLSREKILAKARAQNLVRADEELTDSEVYSLIFAPGFSTAKQVTDISGRGVGMDVVKRNIDAMRGRVSISSELGVGTTFKIVLPLTLAIIEGMLVACGDEQYIIPTLSIVESIQPTSDMLLKFTEKSELLNVRGEIIPLIRLDRLFSVSDAKQVVTDGLVVIVEGVGRRMGLMVDEVLTQQQVVIKSLGDGLGRSEYVSGAAILSDGRVGLIINVDEMAANIGSKERLNSTGAVAV